MTRLSRSGTGRPAPPVRIVHVGPGAFHRAHQAWYTDRAEVDRADPEWGIAAVTARSDDMVERLGGQDGLYSVVTRGADGDGAVIVGSVAEVVGHGDPRAVSLLARPEVTVVTLTLTEAGYGPASPVLSRLVAGLRARQLAGGGPVAVVSCDNLSANGRTVRRAVTTLAATSPGLADWVADNVAFPSTVVDRITPATRPEDLATAARLTGWDDRAAVVTEPHTEWVIEDPIGHTARPAWERAGARFVADVGPWERRKLRLLNAGHSLMAYVGVRCGHRSVHEAIGDPAIYDALVALWDEAAAVLPPGDDTGLDRYRAELEDRWSNARLPHALAQIGEGGLRKLRARIVPTMVASLAVGAEPVSCALVVGAWAAQLRAGAVVDPDVDTSLLAGAAVSVVARRTLALLDGDGDEDGDGDGLAGDDRAVSAVAGAIARLET